MLGGGAKPIDSDEDFAEDNEELLQILEQDDNESIQNNKDAGQSIINYYT